MDLVFLIWIQYGVRFRLCELTMSHMTKELIYGIAEISDNTQIVNSFKTREVDLANFKTGILLHTNIPYLIASNLC